MLKDTSQLKPLTAKNIPWNLTMKSIPGPLENFRSTEAKKFPETKPN